MNAVRCLWLCGAGVLFWALILYRARSAGQRMMDEIARWEREEREKNK